MSATDMNAVEEKVLVRGLHGVWYPAPSIQPPGIVANKETMDATRTHTLCMLSMHCQ